MSDEWAIKVEGLGKRYSIAADRGRYTSFRDVLSQGARSVGRRMLGRGGGPPAREPFWALKDVSFEVPRGECVGVIGRNGAGKSTLLKVLSRITEPTEGAVDLRGRVGSLLEVGTGFHPELTGRENVFLNGAILGMTRREITRKFGEIAAFAEVERFLDTPVKHYSSGMYTRLAFAVAAHLEPEILIVDEVLAVGDAEFQKKCLGKMGEVARSGRTVLFVSHNMAAVRNLCSRVLCLQKGCVVGDGDYEDIVELYSGQIAKSQTWQRPDSEQCGPLRFARIAAKLCGNQPTHSLQIEVALEADQNYADSFLAFDFRHQTGVPIMQAIPSNHAFLKNDRMKHSVSVEVSLPALIPGTYTVSPWVGPHNTITYDLISDAVTFDIENSPERTRTFPHYSSSGFLMAQSSLTKVS